MANPLVPTLAALVRQADALQRDGHLPRARRAWEALVQRAQESGDRATEALSRAMLARCLLSGRDRAGAEEQLALAAPIAEADRGETGARYRAAAVRLALDELPAAGGERARATLEGYLQWAERHERPDALFDACLLAARVLDPPDRVVRLEQALERAQAVLEREGAPAELLVGRARVAAALGTALEQVGELDQALAAYQQALDGFRAAQVPAREAVAAGWAVGALAGRIEDWPLARDALEDAIAQGGAADDCDDLLALALADLATVYEAAGDLIEARRLLVRAVALGREQQLATTWPDRWARLLDEARRLEVA
ncbi:MAG: hypothetical protein R3F59_02420 [Myxococcota bacterium]